MGTRRAELETTRWAEAENFLPSFYYWRGASGRRYQHLVYTLIDCPALPQANYVLVRRHSDGTRTALAIGQTKHDALLLNLAHLRHEGAKRGANEVHMHLLADTPQARDAVEEDLRLSLNPSWHLRSEQ